MKNFTGTIKDKNGNIFHFYNSSLHRVDGPAIEYHNGNYEWYLNGRKHREDGPAVKYANNGEYWYYEGKLHRDDGPAIVQDYFDHKNEYWFQYGKLHRLDGPASIERNSNICILKWYQYGKLHRLDGPAIEYNTSNFIKSFYINGKRISKKGIIKNNKFYYYDSFKDGKFTYKIIDDNHKWKKAIICTNGKIKVHNSNICNFDLKNFINFYNSKKYEIYQCENCLLLLCFNHDIRTNHVGATDEPQYKNQNGNTEGYLPDKIVRCNDYILNNIL